MQILVMNYLLLFLLLLLSCNAGGGNSIEIRNAWIRQVPSNSDITALYFEIKNTGSNEDWVVSISTPISDKVEIHNTVIDSNGSATMVKLDEVKISSKENVKFTPGGMHAMLIGLSKEIKAGDEYQIKINFKNYGNKSVTARVKGLEQSMNENMNH